MGLSLKRITNPIAALTKSLSKIALTLKSLVVDETLTVTGALSPNGFITNSAGMIVLSWGTSVPTGAGYAARSVFIRTSTISGAAVGIMVNGGTTSAANFLEASGIAPGPSTIVATPATVTISQSGHVFIVEVVDCVINLPDVTTAPYGLTFRFVCEAPSGGTGLSISPAATDKIMGLGITAADNKDLINSGATDAAGDFVEIQSDGSTGWYITASRGTWAREA